MDALDETGDLTDHVPPSPGSEVTDTAASAVFQRGHVTEALGSVSLGPQDLDRPAAHHETTEDPAAGDRRPTPQSPAQPRPLLQPPAPKRDRGGLDSAQTIRDTDLPAHLRAHTLPFSGQGDGSQNRLPTIPEPTGPKVDPVFTSPDQPQASPPTPTPKPRRRGRLQDPTPSQLPIPRRQSDTQTPTLVDSRRKPRPSGRPQAPARPPARANVSSPARIDAQAVAKKLGWVPEVGEIIEGWRIEAEVGRGGMGRVYRAFHEITGQKVALKMLMPQGGKERTHRDRFVHEAKVLARLEHPNLVGMLGFFEHRDRLFIVMRFVEGCTLEELLTRRGRLQPEDAVVIFDQICDAVTHVHSHKILHRDLKPANIIMQDGGQVLVTDFGIARAVGDASLTMSGMVVGTAEYVAPEQACGLSRDDLRSDVYALGVLLYEMVTGHVPFSHSSPAEVLRQHVSAHPPPPRVVCPEVPEALDAALLTALAKAPEKRFQTPEAFKKAVHAALQPGASRPARALSAAPTAAPRATRMSPEDEFSRPTRPQPESEPEPPPQRSPWLLITVGLILLGAGATAGWWYLLR